MEYKRLTFRYESVDGTKEVGYTEKLIPCFNKQAMILNRLAEFEDKIEQGAIIEQKQGYWEEQDLGDGEYVYTCTACGCDWCTIEGTPVENNMKYCPECGAKMNGMKYKYCKWEDKEKCTCFECEEVEEYCPYVGRRKLCQYFEEAEKRLKELQNGRND